MTGHAHAATLRLSALGVPIDVEVDGPGAATFLAPAARAWSRAARHGGVPQARLSVRVEVDETPLTQSDVSLSGSDTDELLERLSQLVTLTAIEARAGEAIILHAAGLADLRTGRTLALVAPSGTGKTTVSALMGGRLGYLTDETVVVERDLAVTPYAKPLSVVIEGHAYKEQRSPDALGLRVAPEAHLHKIVLLVRDGGGSVRVERVPLVESLAAVAPETSYLSRVPRPLHRLADVIARTGGVVRAHYGEASQLEPLVDDLLAQP